MNGRAYDYNLGRFLSVDPYIQSTGNSQSLNPYSYIMNNPLSGTDPSGFIACATIGDGEMSCSGQASDWNSDWAHGVTTVHINTPTVSNGNSKSPTTAGGNSDSANTGAQSNQSATPDDASNSRTDNASRQDRAKDIVANAAQAAASRALAGTDGPGFLFYEGFVRSVYQDGAMEAIGLYTDLINSSSYNDIANISQIRSEWGDYLWNPSYGVMYKLQAINMAGMAGMAGMFRGGAKAARSKVRSTRSNGSVNGVPVWKGSGPAPGVLGVNAYSSSNKAIQNYYPKSGMEFIFDPKSKTFLVGNPRNRFMGSPHQQLARTIDANESSVVGGMFSRGPSGRILTNEHSGHFGRNWNPAVRKDFENAMSGYDLPVTHSAW